MNLTTFIEDILFVIVLYKKKPEESAAFRSVQKISHALGPDSVFIYDNTLEPALIKTAIYRHDPANSGVSKAYNEACKFAADKKRTWLLLLDQDTAFDSAFPEHLFSAIIQYPQSSVFAPILKDHKGIVSPFRWSFGKGKRITTPEDKLLLDRYRFANSGLLIKRETFDRAGGYIESIPLDFSDIAFAEKLKKVTDHFIVVKNFLTHSFSGNEYLPLDLAVERFRYFTLGATEMVRIFGQKKIILSILSRALRLTVIYRSSIFIKHLFSLKGVY